MDSFFMNYSMIPMLVSIHTLAIHPALITLIHTCFHFILNRAGLGEDKAAVDDTADSRKCREKTPLLRMRLRLRAENLLLLKRLQGQAALEAKVFACRYSRKNRRGDGIVSHQKPATDVNMMNGLVVLM
ncbi:basic leucine zipper 19-like [Hibiscus syriacus]|uniref:basic leucine zipper 19-like n=1 Tax=Hibiscus syriacus TaxID=106335 RepID=UPI00192396EE|nr:basic leucine zipper 19-like [Hibiscus syriacus]